MKIRQGFVSNSSSSSFLIYGVAFDSSSELMKALGIDPESDEAAEVEDDTYGFLEEKLSGGLSIESPYDSGYHYVGISWDEVQDDETGKEFKDRVYKALNKIFPELKKSDLGTHAEAWYG